jgi:hypothetical protein
MLSLQRQYITSTSDTSALTKTLLAAIRLQRHLGIRIFISTQEPTISPKLLDLCSMTIVHRFTSPDWLRCLRGHLAGVAMDDGTSNGNDGNDNGDDDNDDDDDGYHDDKPRTSTPSPTPSKPVPIFQQIVRLRVGEALLFAPSAILDIDRSAGWDEARIRKLGKGYLKVKIRSRITDDGGRSVLAV